MAPSLITKREFRRPSKEEGSASPAEEPGRSIAESGIRSATRSVSAFISK